jgi:hypothetical protein
MLLYSRPLQLILGIWILADSLTAMILVYPPSDIWFIIRFIRVITGFTLLLEAQRIRLSLFACVKGLGNPLYRHIRVYTSLLGLLGVWLIIDGLTTGLLGYTHPRLLWQLIRIARLIIGLFLILMSFLYRKLQLAR